MTLGPIMMDLRGLAATREERALMCSPAVGGVILFRRNFDSKEQLESLVDEIHGLRQPQLLVAVDQEGGRVQRFCDPFTILPPLRQLGQRFDQDKPAALSEARQIAWLMAAELRSVGVDLSFAPVVDRDLGLSEVIGDRALHPSGEGVAVLAQAYIAGMNRAGMAAVAKHFPTHSGVKADSHNEVATDPRPLEELLDDLSVYRRLVDAGLAGVLMAHVSFPALDPLPAGFSRWWIQSQLRAEMGFKGAVLSDDLSMAGAAAAGDLIARARKALDAGCDMVLACNQPDELPGLIDGLADFSRPESQLRLMRLRGQPEADDWAALHGTDRWHAASELAANLLAPPPLSLEG